MKNASATDLTHAVLPKQQAHRPEPVRAFAGFASAGAVAVVALSVMVLPNTSWFAAGVLFYVLGAGGAGYGIKHSYPHATLGLCNIVTLARLVLVGVLFTALIAAAPPSWAIFSVAVFALALDGVDGWLARRQELTSRFGAQFDVEVDAILALILALYAASSGAAGAFVVLLGLPHYLFWLARLRWPWLKADLYPSFARKAMCVFQIAALISLQVPFLGGGRLDLVIAAVTLALIWSFGRDILWLRQRGP